MVSPYFLFSLSQFSMADLGFSYSPRSSTFHSLQREAQQGSKVKFADSYELEREVSVVKTDWH